MRFGRKKIWMTVALVLAVSLTAGIVGLAAGNGGKKTVTIPAKTAKATVTYPYPAEYTLKHTYSSQQTGGWLVATDTQKAQMKQALIDQTANIYAAAVRGDASYTIPAGQYLIEQSKLLELKNIKRPDNNPFTIIADGVTIWVDLKQQPYPALDRGVTIQNCENVRIKGLVFDAAESDFCEGYIRAIDRANNRVLFEPFSDTLPVEKVLALPPGSDGFVQGARIFNQYGIQMGNYYDVDGTSSKSTRFSKIEASETPGQYWVTFKPEVINTAFDDNWKNTYGEDFTLSSNSLMLLGYGNMNMISMSYCKNMVFDGVTLYYGGMSETDGYGNTQYLDCRFITKPGVNRLLSGHSIFGGGLRHGPIYDNCILGATADDMHNYFARWGAPTAIDTTANTISFDKAPALEPGQHVVFYSKTDGKEVTTLTVKSITSGAVEFTESIADLGFSTDKTFVRYPEWENEGWVIRNSFIISGYQRCMFQAGHGLYENNIIYALGSGFVLGSNVTTIGGGGNEGGSLDDFVFRNNVLVDCGVTPRHTTLYVSYANYDFPIYKNLVFENNLILNSSTYNFTFADVDGLTVKNNILVNPFMGNAVNLNGYGGSKTYPSEGVRQAINVSSVKNAIFKNNAVFESVQRTSANPFSKSRVVGYSKADEVNVVNTGEVYRLDATNAIANRVYELMDPAQKLYASGIIAKIRQEFLSE